MDTKRRNIIIVISAIALVTFATLDRIEYTDYMKETVHDTYKWAVIEDSQGKHMAVETIDAITWNDLRNLNLNKTKAFIGGKIEEYNNKWGFRFKPDSILIVRSGVEDSHLNIEQISSDLDYWKNIGIVYIYAKITETHILVSASSSF
jgi:hypothetical protein